MVPAVIMPLSGWMLSVSLPIIRDDFNLSADVAAWIATGFSLPFMIFMPIYGRLSALLGKRRLLLVGITIFIIGSLLAIYSPALGVLMVGRALQGVGAAGLVPLSLAIISETFPAEQRGSAMGKWSTIGPLMGVAGPIVAGFVVARWGWQASFAPAALAAVVGIVVVYLTIPSTNRVIQLKMLRSFDWIGVALLSITLTFSLFFLSSRPITGVPPLQDWRLLLITLAALILFVWHEKRQSSPFIQLQILQNRSLAFGSLSAMLRMVNLSGALAFLMPLYLADVVDLSPTQSGFFLMVTPAAMVLFVRLGGRISDRLGSRIIGMVGFSVIGVVMFIFSRLPASAPQWGVAMSLFVMGSGTGLMLAALHRAALTHLPEEELGTASGLYSMIRFMGSALGGAIGGILLRHYSDLSDMPLLGAYQHVFLWFVGFAALGFLCALFLPRER